MTQADFTIANQTFPNTRTELNTSLQALATNSAGNSAPSTTFPSQWHYDSDGNQLYIRNKDNDAWVKVFTIGATSDKVDSIADSIAIASTGGVTITTADNTDTLTLISTDTDANAGPNLHLYRNQGTDEGDDDVLGQIKFSGRNDNAQDVLFYRQDVQSSDVSDGAEDGQVRHLIMINGSETEFLRMNPAGVVFNEGGVAGSDFRVESNGNTHMLFVDGGNNAVGIGNTGTLDGVLHIKGAGDTYVVLEAGATDGNTAFLFHNSAGTQKGYINYDTDDNFLTLGVNGNSNFALRIDPSNILSTNAEAAPDAGLGGLTLNQGAADGNILTFKSSDVSVGTDEGEADTYGMMHKSGAATGGLAITGVTSTTQFALNLKGSCDSATVTTTTSTGGYGVIATNAVKRDGSGNIGHLGADDNMNVFLNNATTEVIFKGDGEIFSNQSATVGTFDTYEDAQLVRSLELSRGSAMTGLINSQFDKYIKYNHETLAEANLVGREKDGTPNHFVNITGMQRLHNGAIWQQYEKTERLAKAVYELAKAAVGEEKANEILEQNEIKLLN